MFYKYEITHLNGEDVLYLYISMRYEFAKEFSLQDEKDLSRRACNFISTKNIPFKGNKVYLVVDGIVVKTLDISNISNLSKDSDYSIDKFPITIELEDHSFCEISLREYLLSILFSFYQEDLSLEVYKVIAILFATYAYKKMKEDKFISMNDNFSPFQLLNYYEDTHPNYPIIYQTFNDILSIVDGMYVQYKGQYILPFIHYSNTGHTFTNANYPYLSNVKSLWDLTSPYYVTIHSYSTNDFLNKLGLSSSDDIQIKILNNKKILIQDKIFTFEEFINIFSLKSNDFVILSSHNSIRIVTRGLGNSYGLSIYGANEMAKDNIPYNVILKYYFPKVKLFQVIKELS